MRSIVVGVDESAGAAAALRWAAAERAIHDCTLTAVLCWTYLEQHRSTPDQPFDPEYGVEDACRALDEIVEQVLGDGAGAVERRAVNDHTARGLLDASADSDLLVLGARGLGRWRSLTLGSVTRQCLHHSSVPMAVVRLDVEGAAPGGTRPATNRIVVGVDGSETSKRALAWAIDEAGQRGAGTTVAAVHSWMPPYVGAELVPAMAYDTAEFERIGRTTLDTAVEEADTGDGDVPIERLVMTGPAATVLLDAAERADLLVVGSRGLGGFKGLLFGSVSDYVTHHARCPVVVTPHVG